MSQLQQLPPQDVALLRRIGELEAERVALLVEADNARRAIQIMRELTHRLRRHFAGQPVIVAELDKAIAILGDDGTEHVA